jgi:hypothetical protein
MNNTIHSWLYTAEALVKPATLELIDLEGLDYDYRVSDKIDGVRCLGRLNNNLLTVSRNGVISQVPTEYSGPEAYIDCEDFHGTYIVLDVLYVGFPIIHLSLTQRLAKLETVLPKQRYWLLNQVNDIPCFEGYIVQRDSAPYGVEVFRVKVRETGDFLVKSGKLCMGLPCPRNFPCSSDLSGLEGRIVEVYLDTFIIKCVRYDKQTPNSSVIVARCVSEYRVSVEQFKSKCLNIKPHEDNARENLELNKYSIWEDSEYGRNVRANDPKNIKTPYVEEERDLIEISSSVDDIISSLGSLNKSKVDSLSADIGEANFSREYDIPDRKKLPPQVLKVPKNQTIVHGGKKNDGRKGNAGNRKRKKNV